MFHIPLTRRMTATATYAAAVLVASLISVGTAAAQVGGVTVTVTNTGKVPISINIKDLKDYREDLNGGETKSIPAGNLTGVDPNNRNIQWEARLRDLQNAKQSANTVCARGVVIFQGQTGHIDVTKCDQTAAATAPASAAAPPAPAAPVPVSVKLQQAYGKQWGDVCLSRGSASCCTASERFSGTPDCKTKDTCKVSVHICEQMVACNAALNNCKKTATGSKCDSDYKSCHDKALALSN
jgi:hypothetical protein